MLSRSFFIKRINYCSTLTFNTILSYIIICKRCHDHKPQRLNSDRNPTATFWHLLPLSPTADCVVTHGAVDYSVPPAFLCFVPCCYSRGILLSYTLHAISTPAEDTTSLIHDTTASVSWMAHMTRWQVFWVKLMTKYCKSSTQFYPKWSGQKHFWDTK